MKWGRNKEPSARKLRKLAWEQRKIEWEEALHVDEYRLEEKEIGKFVFSQYNKGWYRVSRNRINTEQHLVDYALLAIEELTQSMCTITEIDTSYAASVGPYEMAEFVEELLKNWPPHCRQLPNRDGNVCLITCFTPEAPMALLRYYMNYEGTNSMLMCIQAYEEPYNHMMEQSDEWLYDMLVSESAPLMSLCINKSAELWFDFQPSRMPAERIIASVENFIKERNLKLEVKRI